MEEKATSEFLLQRLKSYEIKASGLAIAVSGGVDSSLLLSVYGGKVHPYCVGNGSTSDTKYARILCNHLHVQLEMIHIDENMVQDFAAIVQKIDPDIDQTDLGFETVLAVVLGNIREEGLITGQGADEIFYGYSKFRDGRETSNRSSMEKLKKKTLIREKNLASYFGKYLLTPYLDDEIVSAFAGLPSAYNMDLNTNKKIIREAAMKHGLPGEIYNRPKKAAQYGSGVLKTMKKSNLKGMP